MTTVPTKIVLKSTTRMSLSDRFSTIVPTVQNIRANVAAEHQVSAANRRLAQQLANRPGVNQGGAASLMYQQQQHMIMMGAQQQQQQTQAMGRGRGGRGAYNPAGALGNKGNLKQRLGKSNIKNRLSLPAGRGAGNQQTRGGGRGRGGRGAGNNNQFTAVQGGAGDYTYNKPRGRGGFSPVRARGRGVGARGRGTFNRFTGQTIVRGGGRGQRRGRGGRGRGMQRGRGRGGRGGGAKPEMTAQDLDSQLDEYMSKTKSHLDSQLDSYMSEVA